MARVNLAALAASKVETVPGQSKPTLAQIPTDQISTTPLNPRRNFGSDTVLRELGDSLAVRQLQPVVVVSRDAYLELWPEHEQHTAGTGFVLANGERRLRAARLVGLDVVDALIREEVAESRPSFLDALLSENLDRQSFDPIEEAEGVEQMVQECGSAGAAAVRFRRTEAWVSQRRALLRLTPDLQQNVRTGQLAVRVARSVARLPADEQVGAVARLKQEQAEAAQARLAARTTDPAADPAGHNPPRPPVGTEMKTRTQNAAKRAAKVGPEGHQAEALPWSKPEALAAMIRHHMTDDDLSILLSLLSTAPATP